MVFFAFLFCMLHITSFSVKQSYSAKALSHFYSFLYLIYTLVFVIWDVVKYTVCTVGATFF